MSYLLDETLEAPKKLDLTTNLVHLQADMWRFEFRIRYRYRYLLLSEFKPEVYLIVPEYSRRFCHLIQKVNTDKLFGRAGQT